MVNYNSVQRPIHANLSLIKYTVYLSRSPVLYRNRNNLSYYRVFIKSLYNFKNLLQRQMKRQISGNCYKMKRIYLSLFSPHLIHLYMGTISCTKHIRTILDFLHDRCFPQMFLVVHFSFYRTLSLSQ